MSSDESGAELRCHSKKARVLTLSQVNKFLNDSDDLNNLANKVILTFRVLGALRTSEICNLNIQDIEDTGIPSATITNEAPSTSTANQNNPKTNLNDDDAQFTVTINDSKNCFLRNFTVDQEYYGIIHNF
ncbi:Protein of unknown function [Cotesia congregata]|uniref:Uncharacterized protein n=1 Tax=Cotesia congregata TaxID=51543 RepID=A0A8J2H6Q2_COTCN|nr:Protein of unknown function [Cotesia congregata]